MGRKVFPEKPFIVFQKPLVALYPSRGLELRNLPPPKRGR
jgi:hypothetical protein